jgi:hypothetical protein
LRDGLVNGVHPEFRAPAGIHGRAPRAHDLPCTRDYAGSDFAAADINS